MKRFWIAWEKSQVYGKALYRVVIHWSDTFWDAHDKFMPDWLTEQQRGIMLETDKQQSI